MRRQAEQVTARIAASIPGGDLMCVKPNRVPSCTRMRQDYGGISVGKLHFETMLCLYLHISPIRT